MIDALQFLPVPPDESLIYVGSYNPWWVVVSVLLAIFASYAALRASERIGYQSDAVSRLTWALVSALTLGVGTWAMHFVGMLALSLPCGISYDPVLTLASMIPGILAGGVALGVVWHHGEKHLSPLLSSVLLGAGIGTMHYTGMAAMRLDGFVRYNPSLFVLSIIVAVALSYIALRVKNGMEHSNKRRDVLVAVIMGGAVSGMHYTAMSAAYFVRGDVGTLPASVFTTNTIAIVVALATTFLALAALTLAAFSRNREMTTQLCVSEERWKFALEGSGDGMWDWNPQTGEAMFSRRWKEMLGYAKEEFPDTEAALVEHLHPDDKDRVLSSFQECFTGNQPFFAAEFRMRCKDGSWKWIMSRGMLVSRDADGQPLRMIGTHADVSERKHTEEALMRSEAKFHTLYDSTSDAVMLLDEKGFFDCNPAALKIFGCKTSKELCAKHPADLSPLKQPCGGSSMELASRRIAAAMEKGSLQFEWVHKRADNGKTFPAEVLLNAITLDGKTVVQAVVRDISERKRAEHDLRIAAIAFESREGMLITDANSAILRVNRAFTDITGYTAEEAIGKTPRILSSGRHNANFYAAMWESIEQTGGWEGEIWNRRKNGEIYPEHLSVTALKGKNGVVTNYVASISDITLRKEGEEEIKSLAFFDHLTGLPNRRLLQDRLQHALSASERSGRQGALLFIDLDNFKTLNDTLGHGTGDLLLQQVAQRLTSCMREGDSIARLGGDEFVVLLEDLNEHALEAAAQTETVGEKILVAISQPYQLAGHEYRCTPSIGATLFKGHQQSIDELLKQADIAMYQAKKAGRNTLRFFDPQMQESINVRAALEDDLRKALELRQFQLHYQIQVDSSRRPLGAEALIRWLHPERGLVSPAQFIPLAEETGLILPIGLWVLESACAQIKAWQRDERIRDLILAVNISARQFHQADFVAQVQAAVARHAVKPELLKLELTESLLLEDIEDTIATMNVLKESGVRFALDDFGTGYSSLQYLKRLPLDQLKIDRSFVRDIAVDSNDRSIVRTIIAMARSLNLDIIAEGVETEEQRHFLMSTDCTQFQGYLFGKPVPIEQFEAQLKRG